LWRIADPSGYVIGRRFLRLWHPGRLQFHLLAVSDPALFANILRVSELLASALRKVRAGGQEKTREQN